jgi:hypothetical protein
MYVERKQRRGREKDAPAGRQACILTALWNLRRRPPPAGPDEDRPMTRLQACALALLAAASLGTAQPVRAQAAAAAPAAAPVEQEIAEFRKRVLQAITARDEARLRDYYAQGYTHTHGSGGVDTLEVRIAAFLSGAGGPIETLPTDELTTRIFGSDTAVVRGRSPFAQRDGTMRSVRWMIVYARIDGRWRVAASQATILP